MKIAQIFLFLAVCAILAITNAELAFSIKSSDVPNLEYEVDAVQCLQEAYVLYPDNDYRRNDAISKLFKNRHTDKNGWNVAEGCTSSYSPNSTVYVEVLVQDSDTGSQSVVKIFN